MRITFLQYYQLGKHSEFLPSLLSIVDYAFTYCSASCRPPEPSAERLRSSAESV